MLDFGGSYQLIGISFVFEVTDTSKTKFTSIISHKAV